MRAGDIPFDREPVGSGWTPVPWVKERKISKRERSIVDELLRMYEDAGYNMENIEDMAIIFGHDGCSWVRPIAIRFKGCVCFPRVSELPENYGTPVFDKRGGRAYDTAQCMMVNRWRRVKRSGRIEDAFI
jgi:hypothetical protein